MSEHDKDEALIRALRDSFESGLEAVTELDHARLRRARMQALAQAGNGNRPVRRPAFWLAPAALAASAALLALLVLPSGPMPWSTDSVPGDMEEAQVVASEAVSDLEILLAEDDLGLFEDLEFYVWLDAQLADQEMRDAG